MYMDEHTPVHVHVCAHLYLAIKLISPFLQSLANLFSLVNGNLCLWMVLSQLVCNLFKVHHQTIILHFSCFQLFFQPTNFCLIIQSFLCGLT